MLRRETRISLNETPLTAMAGTIFIKPKMVIGIRSLGRMSLKGAKGAMIGELNMNMGSIDDGKMRSSSLSGSHRVSTIRQVAKANPASASSNLHDVNNTD